MEVELLYKHRFYQRAFTLAYTANEDISEGQIVADYISGVTAKEELNRAFKHHDIKAAYGKIKVEIGPTYRTGRKELRNGKELEVFVQDSTLKYDLDETKDMSSLVIDQCMLILEMTTSQSHQKTISKQKMQRK